MAKRKQGIPVTQEERKKREDELHELIYQFEDILSIVQYSKYHFRVFKGNRCVDVWPKRKKYWATWMTGSKVYNQVNEILVEFTKAPKTK